MEELCKGMEDIEGKGLLWVLFGKGEDSFEAIPEILLTVPRGTSRGMRKFHRSHR